jgi:hypothetical protein
MDAPQQQVSKQAKANLCLHRQKWECAGSKVDIINDPSRQMGGDNRVIYSALDWRLHMI